MSLIEKSVDNYWNLRWLDKHMSGHKGFICGGCFKNIFNGEKVKDIDVFFCCKSDFDDAVEYFDDNTEEYCFYYENENVKAYKAKSDGTVVELCCKIFGNPNEILNRFDFTIVKFSYFKKTIIEDNGENHIEYFTLQHQDFFEHLHNKRLVIDDAIPFPMSTLERMFRYAKYGYMPCRETKLKIANALNDLTKSEIEVSESLYDGMD